MALTAFFGNCRLGIVYVLLKDDDEIIQCGGCKRYLSKGELFVRSADRGGSKAGILYPQCSNCVPVAIIACKDCGATMIGNGALDLNLLNEDGTTQCITCEENELARREFGIDALILPIKATSAAATYQN